LVILPHITVFLKHYSVLYIYLFYWWNTFTCSYIITSEWEPQVC